MLRTKEGVSGDKTVYPKDPASSHPSRHQEVLPGRRSTDGGMWVEGRKGGGIQKSAHDQESGKTAGNNSRELATGNRLLERL